MGKKITMRTLSLLGALLLPLLVGCQKRMPETILVIGEAEVKVPADKVSLNVSYSTTLETTLEARKTTSRVMNEVIEIIKNQGISEDNLTTTSLTLAPQYDWRGVGESRRYVLIGQEASQRIFIDVENTPGRAESLGDLYDKLSSVNGITLSSIDFYRDDKTPYQEELVKRAFESAKVQAQRLAELADKKIVGVLKIDATGADPDYDYSGYQAAPRRAFESAKTVVLESDETIRGTLSVVFEIH